MAIAPRQCCGVFGGTFDPIHIGHVETVRQIMTITGLTRVRYIPAFIPPHRPHPGASAEQRLKMVQLAINDEPGLIADDREITRSGHSFTVDTIESLQREFPQTAFSLILGLDALLGLDRWHRWQTLLEITDIIAMVRPGWEPPDPLPGWWARVSIAGRGELFEFGTSKITLLSIDPNPVAATRIRANIRARENVSKWLHPEVWKFIKTQKLYEQETRSTRPEPDA